MIIAPKNSLQSYVSFRLGNEIFATPVSKVQNILEMLPITKVPKSPPYMKGVINLRGTVLPVVDTRIKMNLQVSEFTENTCILVLNVIIEGETIEVGGLVDAVIEVFQEDEVKIIPPPMIGSKYKYENIYGIVKLKDQFIMLLDVDKIFGAEVIFNS